MKTRKQYMNHECTHREFFAQFVTQETIDFVRREIGEKKLRASKDKYFNDIIKHSRGGAGGWIWDHSPMNMQAAIEAGEAHKGCHPSQSTRTCIGKEAARQILEQAKQEG